LQSRFEDVPERRFVFKLGWSSTLLISVFASSAVLSFHTRERSCDKAKPAIATVDAATTTLRENREAG
jgi:hypothetical protein